MPATKSLIRTVWIVTRTDKKSPRHVRRVWVFLYDPTWTIDHWAKICTKSTYKLHLTFVVVP